MLDHAAHRCDGTDVGWGEICDRIGKEVGLIDAHPEAKYANVFFFRAEGARGTKLEKITFFTNREQTGFAHYPYSLQDQFI